MAAAKERGDGAIRDPHNRGGGQEGCGQGVQARQLRGYWYAFGTHDGYDPWEAPDDVSMAAVALAISGGALGSFETTVLLGVEETMGAPREADRIRYRAPGA